MSRKTEDSISPAEGATVAVTHKEQPDDDLALAHAKEDTTQLTVAPNDDEDSSVSSKEEHDGGGANAAEPTPKIGAAESASSGDDEADAGPQVTTKPPKPEAPKTEDEAAAAPKDKGAAEQDAAEVPKASSPKVIYKEHSPVSSDSEAEDDNSEEEWSVKELAQSAPVAAPRPKRQKTNSAANRDSRLRQNPRQARRYVSSSDSEFEPNAKREKQPLRRSTRRKAAEGLKASLKAEMGGGSDDDEEQAELMEDAETERTEAPIEAEEQADVEAKADADGESEEDDEGAAP